MEGGIDETGARQIVARGGKRRKLDAFKPKANGSRCMLRTRADTADRASKLFIGHLNTHTFTFDLERPRRDNINGELQGISHLLPMHRLKDAKARKHILKDSHITTFSLP